MSECTHDCSTCSANCSSRQPSKEDFREKLNDLSRVRKVIGVVSGKGGVGKSLVTSLLAVTFNRREFTTAILDADITGPSIPKAFGVKEKAHGTEQYIIPAVTKTGIQLISVNLLLENETDPVVWRGPVIAGTVKQFWTDVIWKDVDYMFVDMPPGTGDVPLTVFQSLPLDGIVIVTSPQELVSMIVSKAVNMARLMEIPILGIVENMSYVECPDCGKRINIFGESRTEAVAAEFGLKVLAKLPLDPVLANNCDNGLIELFEGDYMEAAADEIEKAVN
jgi:ATPases involved in chromosome partitioning